MKRLIALLMAALLAVSTFGCSTWQEPGKVFYLNCVPEANEAWQKLASTYSDIYGVEVTVRTVTTDDCAATIRSALAWEDAPTVFQFHSAADLEGLKGSCLDLTGSAVLGQMITGNFNLTDGGSVKAIGYSYDAFGLMVNTALLDAAGYEMADIGDFSTLNAVAEDIHSRASELGFDAFASWAADGSTAWQLAQATQYYEDQESDSLNLYRQLLDLYINNSAPVMAKAASDPSLEQFAAGQAVFCLHSAEVYDTLVDEPYQMEAGDLAMIPVYCGAQDEENAALCTTVRSFWAVSSEASAADRQATLDFLNWVVTSEYGISVLQEQFGGVPFKAATADKNRFYGDSNALLSNGNYPITAGEGEDDALKDAITAAAAEYAADQTEENWKKIEEAFGTGQA